MYHFNFHRVVIAAVTTTSPLDACDRPSFRPSCPLLQNVKSQLHPPPLPAFLFFSPFFFACCVGVYTITHCGRAASCVSRSFFSLPKYAVCAFRVQSFPVRIKLVR